MRFLTQQVLSRRRATAITFFFVHFIEFNLCIDFASSHFQSLTSFFFDDGEGRRRGDGEGSMK